MWIVNTTFGKPDIFEEEYFDTRSQAEEYCRKHGLPMRAIKHE